MTNLPAMLTVISPILSAGYEVLIAISRNSIDDTVARIFSVLSVLSMEFMRFIKDLSDKITIGRLLKTKCATSNFYRDVIFRKK